MARAFVIVLDSLGCGGAPDAAEFGDLGANTLGHIIQARQGDLHMPNLAPWASAKRSNSPAVSPLHGRR